MAESSLVDAGKRLYTRFTDAVSRIPSAGDSGSKRVDTSGHASMVREANDSFRKKAESGRTSTAKTTSAKRKGNRASGR